MSKAKEDSLIEKLKVLIAFIGLLGIAIVTGYRGLMGYSLAGIPSKGGNNTALDAKQKVLDDSHDALASTGVTPYAVDQLGMIAAALFCLFILVNLLELYSSSKSKIFTVALPWAKLFVLGLLITGLAFMIFWATTNFPYSNYQPASANSKYGSAIFAMAFITLMYGSIAVVSLLDFLKDAFRNASYGISRRARSFRKIED